MSLRSMLRGSAMTLLGAGWLALFAAPASAYSALYVFGDSLSDAGNVYAQSGGLLPPSPYVGGHFSNGPTWAEDLSTKLGLGTLKASRLGGNDYAYGFATTSANIPRAEPVPLPITIPNIEQQVAGYLDGHGDKADPNALYAMWIGSNDVLNALATVPTEITARIGEAVMSEVTAISALKDKGAQHVLVGLIPDLGLTPELNTKAPEAGRLAAAGYNMALKEAASFYFPGLDISYLDTFSLIENAVMSPAAYGFTDVTTPCLTKVSKCSYADQHLFWDDLHPTAAGHRLIADEALRTLGVAPVPLPGTAALFGAALVVLGAGGAAWQRTRARSAA